MNVHDAKVIGLNRGMHGSLSFRHGFIGE